MQIDFFIYLMYELHQFTPSKITLCHYSTLKLVIFQYCILSCLYSCMLLCSKDVCIHAEKSVNIARDHAYHSGTYFGFVP